jgi:hypothetical protein
MQQWIAKKCQYDISNNWWVFLFTIVRDNIIAVQSTMEVNNNYVSYIQRGWAIRPQQTMPQHSLLQLRILLITTSVTAI